MHGAAERTPQIGCGVARDELGVRQLGVRHSTDVFILFSVHSMVWSDEYRTFVVEEFIQNGV
jgi:hypothetical protein